MSSISSSRAGLSSYEDATDVRVLPVLRWAALAMLLVIEVTLVTARFKTSSLDGLDNSWAIALENASVLARFGMCAISALLIFGGPQLIGFLNKIKGNLYAAQFSWWLLVSHLVTLVVFFELSGQVFDRDLKSVSVPIVWVGLWFAAGLMLLGTLLAAALPISIWRQLARSIKGLVPFITVMALATLCAGQFAAFLWKPLAQLTLWVAGFLLKIFYSDLHVDPLKLLISTNKFTVRIGPGCSGYEGIGLIIVVLSAFLYWFRKGLRFPRAFALLPFGIITIWIANVGRIAALVAIGSSISPSIALGGFHSHAGWLLFNIVALGICAVAWNSSVMVSSAGAVGFRSKTASGSDYPAAPYLLPFLVLIATTMVTSAFASDSFDPLYALRVFAVIGALWYFRHNLPFAGVKGWNWSWAPIAIGAVVFVLWIVAESLVKTSPQVQQSLASRIADLSTPKAALWILFRAFGSIVTVPIAEELAFRGFLTRRLIAEDFEDVPLGKFSWFSFFVSSALFGLLHGHWLAGTLAGMLFAASMYRRCRLIDAIVAHATTNGLLSLYVVTTGQWSVWS